MSGPDLAEIEAMVWSTGTQDQVLVTRILRAVEDYAQAADCPPDRPDRLVQLDRRHVLDRAVPDRRGGHRRLADVPGVVQLDSAAQRTLAEVLGICGEIDSPGSTG